MKRTNFFKSIGASLAVPLVAPLVRFLPAPVLTTDIEGSTDLMPFWIQYTRFASQTRDEAFGSFRMDLTSPQRLAELGEVRGFIIGRGNHWFWLSPEEVMAMAKANWKPFLDLARQHGL